jgi:hypothetical protein
MSLSQSTFNTGLVGKTSVRTYVQSVVLAYEPEVVVAYIQGPAHLPAAFPLGDRVYFFGGRPGQGVQVYTLTDRSWMANTLAPGGAARYCRARATAAGGQLSEQKCRWIGEEFVALASL